LELSQEKSFQASTIFPKSEKVARNGTDIHQ